MEDMQCREPRIIAECDVCGEDITENDDEVYMFPRFTVCEQCAFEFRQSVEEILNEE